MKKRRIAVVTGSRAEYGLLYWLLHEINEDEDLELMLIVTGSHLSAEFGSTFKDIEKDGFNISAKVDILSTEDSPEAIAKSTGKGVQLFAETLKRLHPDILVVLGDRYEIFSAALAAMFLNIPIAHIHGGELTEGVIDDAIRHAMTKMSHYHFVTAEPYRKRVIQLGENPKHVFNFGAPGLDHIARSKLLSREELEKELDFQFGELNFLVTFHPVTRETKSLEMVMRELFRALDEFSEAKIIFTKSNADSGGIKINSLIDDYVNKHPDRSKLFISLGIKKYLSVVKQVDVVIGNSSSGLIEAPIVGTPTVNIGDRQKGRLLASSVVCCKDDKNSIINAINKVLSDEFQRSLAHIDSPYGQGDASHKIKEVLKSCSLNVLKKEFFDL